MHLVVDQSLIGPSRAAVVPHVMVSYYCLRLICLMVLAVAVVAYHFSSVEELELDSRNGMHRRRHLERHRMVKNQTDHSTSQQANVG